MNREGREYANCEDKEDANCEGKEDINSNCADNGGGWGGGRA